MNTNVICVERYYVFSNFEVKKQNSTNNQPLAGTLVFLSAEKAN